ncbi:hypothetical protein QYE76_023252 [Lolium multiflorum]|uniref:Uncharacterized protein n=1 Tax=Lolium multiflorum TaxID=4521 RepID=A0AAD8VUJ7_LOLMU|nr:hypothetical protein QYE76_023252 [Lolium multiflorum]
MDHRNMVHMATAASAMLDPSELTMTSPATAVTGGRLAEGSRPPEVAASATRVHIIDVDAANGVQWPLVLQAICDRVDTNLGSPEVRITGSGGLASSVMCSSAPAIIGTTDVHIVYVNAANGLYLRWSV